MGQALLIDYLSTTLPPSPLATEDKQGEGGETLDSGEKWGIVKIFVEMWGNGVRMPGLRYFGAFKL